MVHTDTDVQLRGGRGRATRAVAMAKKRRVKGATAQRKVTLPMHVWELLESAAALYSDAYKVNAVEMGATMASTTFTVSDALEASVGMFLLSLREDHGALPTDESSKAERDAWVKKLAAQIKKEVFEEYWSKKSH